MQALISGAIQGESTALGVTAVLLVLDLESGEIVHRTEYEPPPEMRVKDQKVQFTGLCWIGDELYACSHNEILVFDEWPPRVPARRISVPGFNDLHHCMSWKGNLAVSNTGLETVDVITLDGELLERHDLLANEPGTRRFPVDQDIRDLPDTKPHARHGNHLFEMDGTLWTGQLRTWDAVRVDDLSQRLEMRAGMPHDGVWIHGRLVFTTTNGHLVEFGADPPHERTIHNLTEMTPDFNQLAWCRGVAPAPGDDPARRLVLFTALRRSGAKEFGYWIKHGHKTPPSHLAEYDVERGEFIRRWWLGGKPGYQLFQIDLLPEDRVV